MNACGARAALVALALSLALPAASLAAPPVMVAARNDNGRLVASWSLPDDAEADTIELSRDPATKPDGSFVSREEYDVLDEDQTRWRSPEQLTPGTWYVHVSAYSLDEEVESETWSNVLGVEIVAPVPQAGRYSGRTEFPDGAPVSFRLAPGARRVEDLKVRLQLACPPGELQLKLEFRPIRVGADGTFAVRDRLRFHGGGWLFFEVQGELVPPARATGTLTGKARLPGIGRCKNFLGTTVEWTARRR